MNNSYIVVVTDVETGATHFHAKWEPMLPEHEPEQRDEILYRHAQPTLAKLINHVGSGSVIAHIELLIA